MDDSQYRSDTLWSLRIEEDEEPQAGLPVWITNDPEGAIIRGKYFTDRKGEIIVALEPGTYYLFAGDPDCLYMNAHEFTVTD